MPITFILLQFESPNLMCFLQNFISANLGCLSIPKSNIAISWHLKFLRLPVIFIVIATIFTKFYEFSSLSDLRQFMSICITNIKMQHGGGRYLELVNCQQIYSIKVARITKFDVFSSEFDFRWLVVYTANAKIHHGGRSPS